MRVLFLDVDGVLHPAASGSVGATISAPVRGYGAPPIVSHDMGDAASTFFGRAQMQCLSKVVRESGAEIVLSSAWRLQPCGVAAVNRALLRNGLPAILSCTPSGGGSSSRVDEIWAWLASRPPNEIEGYAVVDDTDLSYDECGSYGNRTSKISQHFVRTPSGKGLASSHVLRLLAKLKMKPKLPSVADALLLKTSIGMTACADLPITTQKSLSAPASRSASLPCNVRVRSEGAVRTLEALRNDRPGKSSSSSSRRYAESLCKAWDTRLPFLASARA